LIESILLLQCPNAGILAKKSQGFGDEGGMKTTTNLDFMR